jgi:carbohydrate phosphorylase
LADLKSYLDADERLCALYADPDEWARKAILNVAGSGKFSSDRTIAEYAAEIWKVQPCPVPGEEGLARISNHSDPRCCPSRISSGLWR